MTLKEVQEKVAESPHSDWLQSLSFNVRYQTEAENTKKEGFTSIFSFFDNQANLWKKKENLPRVFENYKQHFQSSRQQLINFLNRVDQINESARDNEWNNIFQQIRQIRHQNNHNYVLAESPEVDFLIELSQVDATSFNTGFNYLLNKRVDNLNSPEQVRGLIMAYEFEAQNYSEILSRRNQEKKSISQIRSGFDKNLSEAEVHTQEYLNKTVGNYEEHLQVMETLKKNKAEIFDAWFGTSKQEYSSFHDTSHEKIKELEELYIDKLRLAAPVTYWQQRSLQLKKDGQKWGISFAITTFLAALSLFVLLWLVPDEMTAALFKGEAQAIKWTLLYITFISFLAYGVRTFAKLTFSSYHLARDAEEREQLTHVYLALKKEGNVEKEDRQIILQSLFSRAETGLLKDDSTPTMPGTFLEKISGIK
ncbi:MAG: hypothetical protein JXR20_04665 [Balneola sp.]